MVSIQYGGGPNLEQRQIFCNGQPGSHLPGYFGFVPQLKFNSGKTYGQESHECASKLSYYQGPHNQTVINHTPKIGPTKDFVSSRVFKDEIIRKRLPVSTGDNKYTQNMMPGYSGDIPRVVNKFGGTYRAICDEGIDEFITDYERNKANLNDILKMSSLFPRLRAICGNPRVKDHMNLWSNELLKTSTLVSDRKELTEPPMPAFTGFIPRMYNTELGLAARYNQAAKRSLEMFKDENRLHYSRLNKEMKVIDNIYTVANQKPLSLYAPSEPRLSRRIFNKDGMLPSYTGHLHKSKEQIGYTHGDTSRSLDVCKHEFQCYGDFVKNIDLAT